MSHIQSSRTKASWAGVSHSAGTERFIRAGSASGPSCPRAWGVSCHSQGLLCSGLPVPRCPVPHAWLSRPPVPAPTRLALPSPNQPRPVAHSQSHTDASASPLPCSWRSPLVPSGYTAFRCSLAPSSAHRPSRLWQRGALSRLSAWPLTVGLLLVQGWAPRQGLPQCCHSELSCYVSRLLAKCSSCSA